MIKSFKLLCVIVTLFSLSSCNENNKEEIVYTHISSKEDLLLLNNGGNFILDNDIDCEGLSLKAVQDFTGTINGNNYKIHNVKFISENNYFGLIGSVKNGISEDVIVKNLGIENFVIDTNLASSDSTLYLGGIIGGNYQTSTSYPYIIIENCYVDGTINVDVNVKDLHAGGMVGFSSRRLKMSNCYSDVDISCEVNNSFFKKASLNVGGLVGETYEYSGHKSKFENTLFTGSLEFDTTLTSSLTTYIKAGGIVGYSDGICDIKYCLSTPTKILLNSYFEENVMIGFICGKTTYSDEYVKYSYWCNYDDNTLLDDERKNKCSIRNCKVYTYGTSVKYYKDLMLSEEFMKGNYTFIDLNGETKDSFLQFDSNIWNYGYYQDDEFVYPSLKSFN